MPLTWQHGNYECTVHVVDSVCTTWSIRYLLPGAGQHWAKSGTAKNYAEARQKIDREIEQAELGYRGA